MSLIRMPVTNQIPIELSPSKKNRLLQVADELRQKYPQLQPNPRWDRLVTRHLEPAGALHLEEWTEVQLVHGHQAALAAQDRPRCRAVAGDWIVTCGAPCQAYEEYCRKRLGLGAVQWLHPKAPKDPLHLAEACWEDRSVRRSLVRLLRSGQIGYLHPHMGSRAVWELAGLLSTASRRSLQVIAPPPELSQLLNDKLEFAFIVQQILGEQITPKTYAVWDRAHAAHRIRQLILEYSSIGVKLPCSAGGDGNMVLPSDLFMGHSLAEVAEELHNLLPRLDWEDGQKLLVTGWEPFVFATPSCQLWIPPIEGGMPVVEGVFTQRVTGPQASFVGCRRAVLPEALTLQITEDCYFLGALFQQLGYVGRCSFDLLIVGRTPEEAKLQFIECNARWGGTSLPMTLMNQIFGDASRVAYAVIIAGRPELAQLSWEQLIRAFEPFLFDVSTGRGQYILYNPSKLHDGGRLGVIAVASDFAAADHLAHVELHSLLNSIA
jgi:hypothetical protein